MSNETLYKLFTALGFACFALIILQPLWNYTSGSINSCIYFIVGWTSATIASKIKNN